MLRNRDIETIPGWPGYSADKGGDIWSGGRRLKTSKTSRGHLIVKLYRDGKGRNQYVHRLILETFVGPCPEGMEACHRDDDKENNRLDNLRWDTPKANSADAKRNGKTRGKGRSPRKPLRKTT